MVTLPFTLVLSGSAVATIWGSVKPLLSAPSVIMTSTGRAVGRVGSVQPQNVFAGCPVSVPCMTLKALGIFVPTSSVHANGVVAAAGQQPSPIYLSGHPYGWTVPEVKDRLGGVMRGVVDPSSARGVGSSRVLQAIPPA